MVELKQVVTTILLLVAIGALFYLAYYEYSSSGSLVTFTGAVAAASGVALLLSILKVWTPNVFSSSQATMSGFGKSDDAMVVKKFHRADDSSSSYRKRWWRQ